MYVGKSGEQFADPQMLKMSNLSLYIITTDPFYLKSLKKHTC